MLELATGKLVGEYTVEKSLVSGGMATVFLADAPDGTRVVLKFPHISMLGDPAIFERYQREMEIGRRLNHPYIQQVLATGEYEGYPFMVTRYTEGETLRAYLSRREVLPLEETLVLLDKLCQGVAYCHSQGVFHRDLKPENIIMTAQGDPVIIDFGIAMLQGARRITWSGLSPSIGTPDYMAPEQIQGKRGDVRTDVYALGAMGYEMLTGNPPFSGDNPLAIMGQHMYSEVVPPHTLHPEIPATLSAIIVKSLERNPDQRYQTVNEFRDDFLHYVDSKTTIAQHQTRKGASHRIKQVIIYTVVIGAIIAGIIALGIFAQFAHSLH